MEPTTHDKMKAAREAATEKGIHAVLHDGSVQHALGDAFHAGVAFAMDELRAESQGLKDGSL